jgi:hypothetical protein
VVTEDRAIEIATELVRKSLGRSLRVYYATYISSEKAMERAQSCGMPEGAMEFRSHWGVSFELTMQGPNGRWSVVDGGPMVDVDVETGEATFQESL